MSAAIEEFIVNHIADRRGLATKIERTRQH